MAAQLAQMAPEQVEKLRGRVRRLGEELAHQFGLTEDEEHLGWRALLVIGFELYELKLKDPLKQAYHIETQLAGVLDQAFKWLGGVGNAADAGINAYAKFLGFVEQHPWWLLG